MEFVISKADFLRELTLSQRIVEKKNTIPILSNILLEVSDTELTLTATDLEVGLQGRCKPDVKTSGSVTVSAKKLFEVVRALPDDDVRVKANDSLGITITCGRAEFRLVGLDPKDFPNLPECDFAGAWELEGALFRQLVGKVIFAVTSDESRFPLAGVLLLGSRERVTLVSTDGHRLAIAEASSGLKGQGDEIRLLIPRKALLELKQIAELGDDTIRFEVRENHIYFRVGQRSLVARMIEDQFPEYDKVIPKGNDKTLAIDKMGLDGAVRRAALLSSEKAKVIRFSFSDGILTISASNPELGEVREEIPLDYSAEAFEIAFNAQYLLDFFAVVEGDAVQFELKDSSTQALLRPAVSDGDNVEVSHYYVIMPMRL